MSTVITEKYNKWSNKVQSGSSSILMISRADNSWYLDSNGHAKKLSSTRIIVYDGDDMTRSEYTDTTPVENDCILLIKDEQKMILSRGETRLDAFGMDPEDSTAKMVFFYGRTPQVHILVAAHHASPSVNVMFYPVSGEKDAFSLCMEAEGILPCGSTKKEDVS
jgi:hypothetical protein